MKKQPHIIIFNPDQMRADALAHLGNPASKTPFLDEFSKDEAVSFSHAYCQNTVCVPSRCSFLTGLYPHVYGHRTMNYLLREGEKSLFMELMDEGYEVWMNSRNDLVAGQIEGLMEKHADEIFYGGECEPVPGSMNPQVRGTRGEKNYYSHYIGQMRVDEAGRNYTTDDEDIDAAVSKIKNRDNSKPLCMFLGLVYPHPNYRVEEPYYSAIDRKKLTIRARGDETHGKPKILDMIRNNQEMQDYTEDDWKELRATYFGMCMKVDNQFKKLCDGLKEAGIYDDSAIFFFSDHGDYTGDYDISEKAQNTFEDCLTRVPLLIKPPKGTELDPGVTDSVTELIDFYATVLDYANITSKHTNFGKSLRPVISNRHTKNREYAFCEGGRMEYEWQCDEYHTFGEKGIPETSPYYPRLKAQLDSVAHGKGTMITDGTYKYVRRIYEEDEFYDLVKDPQEKVNVIDKDEYKLKISEMQLKMLEWYQGTCDIVPYDYDSRFNYDMTWSRVKKICPEEHVEEVVKKIHEGVDMHILIGYCKSLNSSNQNNG